MQITRVYSDGSFIKVYEKGDQVKIVVSKTWLTEPGEIATVTSDGQEFDQNCLINTISMKKGGWDSVIVDCSDIEPYGKTLLQVPYLIQKWKEKQVKTLLVGETYATNG